MCESAQNRDPGRIRGNILKSRCRIRCNVSAFLPLRGGVPLWCRLTAGERALERFQKLCCGIDLVVVLTVRDTVNSWRYSASQGADSGM
jgi:hypothetical protein